MTTYARQKAAAQRMLKRYGGGAVCTLHKPQTTTGDPAKPWTVTTDPSVDFSGVSCAFFPTDFRFDMSSGYWPDSILPEARSLALIAAADIPQAETVQAGWSITRQDGSKVTILRANLIAPDSINKILYLAQVSG